MSLDPAKSDQHPAPGVSQPPPAGFTVCVIFGSVIPVESGELHGLHLAHRLDGHDSSTTMFVSALALLLGYGSAIALRRTASPLRGVLVATHRAPVSPRPPIRLPASSRPCNPLISHSGSPKPAGAVPRPLCVSPSRHPRLPFPGLVQCSHRRQLEDTYFWDRVTCVRLLGMCLREPRRIPCKFISLNCRHYTPHMHGLH